MPPNSEPGDLIAIVDGLKTPYVVRLKNTADKGFMRDGVHYFVRAYELVGECFIFGTMDGGLHGGLYGSKYMAPCTIV